MSSSCSEPPSTLCSSSSISPWIASLTGWNAALRAKGEIALGADYRWNSRIQLGYTLGRVVGYLFFAVVIILLLVAVTLMLMGQLKL